MKCCADIVEDDAVEPQFRAAMTGRAAAARSEQAPPLSVIWHWQLVGNPDQTRPVLAELVTMPYVPQKEACL